MQPARPLVGQRARLFELLRMVFAGAAVADALPATR